MLKVNRKLKPYVIEVNRSPSFTCDSELDREIKVWTVEDRKPYPLLYSMVSLALQLLL